MTVLLIVLIVFLVPVIIGWTWGHGEISKGLRGHPFLRAGSDVDLPDPAPMLSVIIPAHNEERNIRRTLDAVVAQDYPSFEVIVASDRSTDATASIVREFAARDPRVRLFENHDLPEEWSGRSYVIQKASETASGEILHFTDADVALDPGAFSTLVTYFTANRLDMLSLFLRQESSNLWDKVVFLFICLFTEITFPFKKVNDPKSPVAMAVGQSITVRTDVYHAIDGHERIKSLRQDDVAFAKLVKGLGYRSRLVYGFDMGAGRWYPTMGRIWTGWTLNIYGLIDGSFRRVFDGVLRVILPILVPHVTLVVALVLLLTRGADVLVTVLLAMSLAAVVLFVWFLLRFGRVMRADAAPVTVYLAGFGIFCGILLWAAVMRFRSSEVMSGGKPFFVTPHGGLTCVRESSEA